MIKVDGNRLICEKEISGCENKFKMGKMESNFTYAHDFHIKQGKVKKSDLLIEF